MTALAVHAPQGLDKRRFDARAMGQTFAEALAIAAWRVDFFDGKATIRSEALAKLALSSPDRGFADGLADGLAIDVMPENQRHLGDAARCAHDHSE